MAQQQFLEVADQRDATARLCWLTLHAPQLARSVRAGQYLLVRCAETGSYDPLLRRALFIAAAEPALGQIGLLYQPDERGLRWLARARPGDALDVFGPLGQPFAVGERTRNLFLVGQGPGLSALLLLAQQSAARDRAVTLLVSAADPAAQPPPFLLPGAVEYQSVAGLHAIQPELPSSPFDLRSAIGWADQVCAALPTEQLRMLRDAIAAAKLRWERGFASAVVEGPIVCGVGACGVCTVALRKGLRLLCSDGPVFDLRELALAE
jgi:dihydroorotate dehydrogenase electron transfer subunit